MTNLKSRIMRAAELTYINASYDFRMGSDVENKRLRPLIEALATAVETLELMKEGTPHKERLTVKQRAIEEAYCNEARQALANLERVVGKE